MNKTNKSSSSSNKNPKRVAGVSIVRLLGVKTKKKRKATDAATSISSVPSILKSVPSVADSSSPNTPAAAKKCDDDGFEEMLSANNDEIPSDALLCLKSYTQSSPGMMMSDCCAYCPIFAYSGNDDGGRTKLCTHAAPFLPQNVLLHILDNDADSSSRMRTELDIKSLASVNKIRLLQLHGTAIVTSSTTNTATKKSSLLSTRDVKFSSSGVAGLRGDGNDDDDVAIMEIQSYESAVEMALQRHLSNQSQEGDQQQQIVFDIDSVSNWFLKQLVPYYAGKTWISSSSLDSFIQSYRVKEYWTVDQMNKLIHELTCAGLLLPRRGVSSRMDGYWFSLPGLGNAAKSIADGRVAILRKLRSCKYQEKKRLALEREYGEVFKDGSNGNDNSNSAIESKKKNCIQQSGKFLVLDLLAKGLVILKTTSSGEHFIGLSK